MAMTAGTPRVAIILSIVALTLHGTSAGAPKDIVDVLPTLTMDPADPKAGDDVTLTCALLDWNGQQENIVLGEGEYIDFFFRVDPERDDFSFLKSKTSGILKIENAQASDSGEYYCKAYDQVDFSSETYEVVIDIQPAPTTTLAPTTPEPTTTPAATTQAPLVTKEITLESWNWNYYARSWAHLGSVQLLVLVKEHDYVLEHASPLCHQEGDNATFGFYGATTWVKDGCRGDFTVTLDTQDTAAAKYKKLVAKFQGLIDETHLLESTVESQNSMIAELTSMVDELENPSSAASTAAPTTEKVLTWRDVICPASGYTVVHDLSKDCSGYVTCSQGVATHTPCWENAFFDPVGWTCKEDPALSCL